MVTTEEVHPALVERLELTTMLGRGEAVRVVEEVLDYFSETVEELVRRRHRELHQAGTTNPAVFGRIRDELACSRVAPPSLSERQLRRIVYG